MRRRNVVQQKVSRLKTRYRARALFACFSASLSLLAVAFVLDLGYWNARLSLESARRACSRYSTSDDETVVEGASFKILDRSENQTRLFASAEEYRRARGYDAASEAAVAAGLARWGLDETQNALDVARLREEDNLASRAAIDALEAFESDDALDAALAFLNDLDGDPIGSDSDYALWSFADESGDPMDAAGIVSERDFVASPLVQSARKAAAASSRVFLILTFGVFLLTPGVRAFSVTERFRAFWERLVATAVESLALNRFLFTDARRFETSKDSLTALRSVRLLI